MAIIAMASQSAYAYPQHHGDSAPVVNPGLDGAAVSSAPDTVSQQCITFTYASGRSSWTWANSYPWSGSGTWGGWAKSGSQMCFPTNNGAGGAMYVGTEKNPAGGNTKLECFFPTSGTANCDISLVDGYSVALKCTIAGHGSVGGSTDLWTTGKPCVDGKEEGETICLNDEGYAPSQSDVTPFFQQGLINGNNYCIWDDCAQSIYFPVGTAISCQVGSS